MKFFLVQVTFSLANSQFRDNSGHSLPPGLRVPDSVHDQIKALSNEEKRVPDDMSEYSQNAIEYDIKTTRQPALIEYSKIVISKSEGRPSNQSERGEFPEGNLHVAVEVQTGDTFVNVTSIDDSYGMTHVNDTFVGNYTENYIGDFGNYTDYIYNDTYYYDNVTYEYYDDQYYEAYDTFYYDEYNVDYVEDLNETQNDVEKAQPRLTYEQMLSSPPPRGTFNLQMALIDSRNHGYGIQLKSGNGSGSKYPIDPIYMCKERTGDQCCSDKNPDCFTPGGCFCDASCRAFDDCCPDFEETCVDKSCLKQKGDNLENYFRSMRLPPPKEKSNGSKDRELPSIASGGQPKHVEPNACCNGRPYNSGLRCCCNDQITDQCPCA